MRYPYKTFLSTALLSLAYFVNHSNGFHFMEEGQLRLDLSNFS